MNWRLPEHWPDDIGRYWLQARRNIEDRNWEAAALMARSALQAALKNKNASGNSLKQEIDDLAAKGILAPVMKECAHQIRLLGNESAHPEIARVIDSQDARDIVEFLTYLLQYLYTFPHRVQQYQDRRQVKKNLIERRHLEDSTPIANWKLTDEIHNELSTIAERFRARTTLEERETIGHKVAALRINAEGSKGMAWREIRKELRRTEGLHLKQEDLREVIRREDHFRESVVERIESFEGGWECQGDLTVLCGFEPTGEWLDRIEACKPRRNNKGRRFLRKRKPPSQCLKFLPCVSGLTRKK